LNKERKMPSSYAHKKFGSLVYKALPKDVRELVFDHLDYYLAGLHGPDVLFYYMPGADTPQARLGQKLHKEAFVKLYNKAIEVLNEDDSDEKLVYFLGVICHYISDSACHPLVAKAIEETGMSHGKIEKEFERFLLINDDKNPMKYPCTAHIPVGAEVAEAASVFYKGITKGEFLSALVSMKAVGKICEIPNSAVRNSICRIMDVTGNSEKVASLMMSRQPSQILKRYLKELDKELKSSVSDAVEEVVKFARNYSGVIIASERLKLDFSGCNHSL
jgi:hypothetical protein